MVGWPTVVGDAKMTTALCADPDQRAVGIIRLCMLTGAPSPILPGSVMGNP